MAGPGEGSSWPFLMKWNQGRRPPRASLTCLCNHRAAVSVTKASWLHDLCLGQAEAWPAHWARLLCMRDADDKGRVAPRVPSRPAICPPPRGWHWAASQGQRSSLSSRSPLLAGTGQLPCQLHQGGEKGSGWPRRAPGRQLGQCLQWHSWLWLLGFSNSANAPRYQVPNASSRAELWHKMYSVQLI